MLQSVAGVPTFASIKISMAALLNKKLFSWLTLKLKKLLWDKKIINKTSVLQLFI